MQSVHVASRYRWFENSQGLVTSNSLQWQSMLRGRFLFDEQARYSVHALAATGAVFVSSWNNTGVGLGDSAGNFSVKQLFLAAEPVKGLEFQVGGLYMNRGELAENITYDTDAYIVGERVTVRPSIGPLAQVAVTAGYIGEFGQTNVFKRFDRLDEYNYGQALIGFRLGPRVSASVDYTYQDDLDIIREGVNIRMPASVRHLTLLKFEAYQRVSDDEGKGFEEGPGFNASGDLRFGRVTVTAGVMSVDQNNGVLNGDRYFTGKRQYSIGSIPLNSDFSLGWFQSEAFGNDFRVAQKHRFDVFVIFNPTASLRRAGIF